MRNPRRHIMQLDDIAAQIPTGQSTDMEEGENEEEKDEEKKVDDQLLVVEKKSEEKECFQTPTITNKRSFLVTPHEIPSIPQSSQQHHQNCTMTEEEDDMGWSHHWDEPDACGCPGCNSTSPFFFHSSSGGSSSSNPAHMDLVDSLPPQLHPAVSLGMRRVSSCAYLSFQGSEADLQSLSSEMAALEYRRQQQQQQQQDKKTSVMTPQDQEEDEQSTAAADWLYHDVIIQVLTFLDASSLSAFSQTARRCNFECFYFLQLQLQRALLLEDNLHFTALYSNDKTQSTTSPRKNSNNQSDQLAAIAGSWSISRLASMDKQEAESVVQEYLDSNSTLKTMPLSHSLAYIRQVLRRNGFSPPQGANEANAFTASAAVVIGLVGAATVMSGSVPNVEMMESFGTELPNMLFKVGFVGSLMGVARGSGTAQEAAHSMRVTAEYMAQSMKSTMREKAEQMAQKAGFASASDKNRAAGHVDDEPTCRSDEFAVGNGQEEKQQEVNLLRNHVQEASIPQRMYDAFLAASGQPAGSRSNGRIPREGLLGPNPYEHLPCDLQESKVNDYAPTTGGAESDANLPDVFFFASEEEKKDGETGNGSINEAGTTDKLQASTAMQEKKPSGCVGAYFRAIQRASNLITQKVQEQRRARFEAHTQKELLAQAFIDACCSDDSLDIVKDLVQKRGEIDAQGFYVGSDGTQTCALHASAFHGATKVLEFLCGGIDELDATNDGGLCSVNVQDENGWTALHFAAGANCAESVRILADRGASLSITAENGYTPLQWAERLRNEETAAELRQRLEAESNRFQPSNNRWPLSMIANRFFAMIPTQ